MTEEWYLPLVKKDEKKLPAEKKTEAEVNLQEAEKS